MSRIRSIRQSFFTDEHNVQASPLARLMLIGIWTATDDHGVFEWKPRQLRIDLFPDQEVDVEGLLAELVRLDRLRTFDRDGRRYGVVRNFGLYQKPKKPNYHHPLPDELADYAGFPHHGCSGGQPPGKGKGSAKTVTSRTTATAKLEKISSPAPDGPARPSGDQAIGSSGVARSRKNDIGTKSTYYHTSSSPPVGNGGEPVPLGEERRGREERDSSVGSSLGAARPPDTDAGGGIGASDAACRALIAAFDEALAAEWGPAMRRAFASGRDYPVARQWLAAGADAALVREVAGRLMPGMHQRNFVPKLLVSIDTEMRAALADRARMTADGRMDLERERWQPRMSMWVAKGLWLESWGDPPGQPGCQMPKRLQDEVLKKRVA